MGSTATLMMGMKQTLDKMSKQQQQQPQQPQNSIGGSGEQQQSGKNYGFDRNKSGGQK